MATLLALSACSAIDETSAGNTTTAERAAGGEIVFGAEDEPSGFNYATSKDSILGVRDVVENLFFFAAKSRPDGTLYYEGLAAEPAIVSDQPQIVEWKINPDSTWSDGTPVTTQDIKYYFDNVTNPKNDVASRVGYDLISKLDLVDAKTFRATFRSRYGDFRGLWQAVPQAAHLKSTPGGWENGLNNDPGPSAGPYKFERWTKGESITLVPNPQWKLQPKPTVDRIVFRFLPESSTIPDALRNQEINIVEAQAQLDLMQDLQHVDGLKLEISTGPRFEHLVLNHKDPVVGDPAVRKAIAHALDRDAIVKALVAPFQPEAKRLDNMVLTNAQAPGSEPHGEQYHSADPEAAKRILQYAGWIPGPNGVRAKSGKQLTIQFSAVAGNQRQEQTLELIKNQLSKVGINLTIDTCPAACLFSDRLPAGKFQITLKGFSGSPFPVADARARFGTGGGDNYSKYSNARFDELAKQAAETLQAQEQIRLANEMDKVLWEDLPMLPLFQRPDLVAYRASLVGIEPNGTRDGVLWNAAGWGLSK
ncbi:ABC transporter family substrate-binding protein [Kribbella caucasensis]|uniref:ABC transporter family substrate-binding protein n=1 Tax=Kribbella caucasensis TaxID=2512215 RepID=UPI001415069A|nr:ABC transporter family substrate-binding protein [Kribbella sp. VKM Ac-2527]